jgi:hypothetical protein
MFWGAECKLRKSELEVNTLETLGILAIQEEPLA